MVPPAFTNVASLTEAFPSGLYQYVGQSDLGSVTVPLQMSELDAVSDPVFAQLTSIPHDALDQAWSLHWEAMAGAAGNSSLSLSIEDLNGNRVFHAPNECEQIELSPTATSISLPAGLLMAGQSYKVSLNFFTLTDQGQNQSLGISHYAGIGKRTEMLIGPGNGNTQPVSLEFSHITQDQGGVVTLTVSGTLNVSTPSVMIEQTTDWRNWTPFKEVTLDMLSQGGGSAQLTDASAPLFPVKFYRIP